MGAVRPEGGSGRNGQPGRRPAARRTRCTAEEAHHATARGDRRRRSAGLRAAEAGDGQVPGRSEEHTSELQSLMRISYADFCLKKKKKKKSNGNTTRQ